MTEVVDNAAELMAETQGSEIQTAAVIPLDERKREAFRIAALKYESRPDWVTFFREVIGTDGVLAKLFPSPEDQRAFEASSESREIQQMLNKLRERPGGDSEAREPIRVITVRLPKSLHEFLKKEAEDRSTSINQLCIAKLIQVLGEETS